MRGCMNDLYKNHIEFHYYLISLGLTFQTDPSIHCRDIWKWYYWNDMLFIVSCSDYTTNCWVNKILAQKSIVTKIVGENLFLIQEKLFVQKNILIKLFQKILSGIFCAPKMFWAEFFLKIILQTEMFWTKLFWISNCYNPKSTTTQINST